MMGFQFFQRSTEQELGAQPHAMNGPGSVLPQVHFVEVCLENLLLAVMQLQQHGHGHFQELA